MKTKVVTVLTHIIVWTIFLSLPYIFRPKPMMGPDIQEPMRAYFIARFLLFNIFLITLFYVHAYWMLPRLFNKKFMLLYTGLIIVFFALFLFLSKLFFTRPMKMPGKGMEAPPGFDLFRPDRIESMFLFFVIMMISGAIWIIQEWKRAEKKAKLVEAERMTMELSFLRSQINPHFLFNTLNSIYSLALVKSDATADAVMKLSDMMRYITQEAHADKVSLEMEVEYISHYVDLQKIRLGENVKVQLNLSGNFNEFRIAPLILMPFVENSFKYGISSHEPAPISIDIRIIHNLLTLKISNRIFPDRKQNGAQGLGISNTRQRLELSYPSHHELTISDNGQIFIVNLMMQLA
ncbi:MAG: sensor histidine kinase [Bacteroidetes bacterium]|nr:sensor histidine kinase [Bacteroidota bacterium]